MEMSLPEHSLAGVQDEQVSLKRRFGLLHCVSVLLGLSIGTGIYISPAGVLQEVPSSGLALILWVIGGVVGLSAGLVWAELGTTYPRCGDAYVYLEMFYGETVAFFQLWQFLFFFRPSSNAIYSLVVAEYIIQPIFPDCPSPGYFQKIIAIALCAILTFINSMDVTLSGRLNVGCAAMGVGALLIIIGAGLAQIVQGETQHFSTLFENSDEVTATGIFFAFYYLIFCYGGCFGLGHIVEEIKNPYRTIPLALVLNITIVIILYLAVNVVYVGVLGPEAIRNSAAVGMLLADVTLGRFSWVIAAMVAVSIAGGLNGGVLVGSRIAFAGGRRGHLPSVLSLINIRTFAPAVALVMQLVVTIPLIAFVDLGSLVINQMMIVSISDSLVAWGLVYRRIKQPHEFRPLKIPLVFPIMFGAVCTCLVFGPLVTRPYETCMFVLLVIGTGLPYYVVFVRIRYTALDHYSHWFIVLCQKLFVSVPQETAEEDMKTVLKET